MKTCTRCKLEKPETEFGVHTQSRDGLHPQCRSCRSVLYKKYIAANPDAVEKRKVRSKQWRENNKERARKLIQEWCEENRDHLREKKRLWSRANAAKMRTCRFHYMINNPDRTTANRAVAAAVRRGLLIKEDTCSECGSGGKISAHHDDYTRPLTVRWLCSKCHKEWHKNNVPVEASSKPQDAS